MSDIWATSDLDGFLKKHNYGDYSGILLSKNGDILYENYTLNYQRSTSQDIAFLTPGLIGLLTGIALDRHYLKSVEVPIRTILPEFDCRKDHLHRILKVKHLLSMSSGLLFSNSKLWLRPIYEDLLSLNNPALALSNVLVKDVPGMKYCYKEWDFILLATILEKILPCSLDEFCQEALFEPLGIHCDAKEYCISSEAIIKTFFSSKQTINASIEDIYKIGKMLLNNGIYENKRIISAGYIREMLKPQRSNANYGYMWTLYPYGYGITDRCGQSFLMVPDKKICYIILTRHKYTRKDYSGIFTKLMEKILEEQTKGIT